MSSAVTTRAAPQKPQRESYKETKEEGFLHTVLSQYHSLVPGSNTTRTGEIMLRFAAIVILCIAAVQAGESFNRF